MPVGATYHSLQTIVWYNNNKKKEENTVNSFLEIINYILNINSNLLHSSYEKL